MKNDKIKIIVITIAAILVLGTTGYLANKKLTDQINKKDNKEEMKEETLSLTSSLVKEL